MCVLQFPCETLYTNFQPLAITHSPHIYIQADELLWGLAHMTTPVTWLCLCAHWACGCNKGVCLCANRLVAASITNHFCELAHYLCFLSQVPCNWFAFVSLDFWSTYASRYWVLLFFPLSSPHPVFVYRYFHFFSPSGLNEKKREVFPQHNMCHHHFHPPPSVHTHLLTCWCKHISQVVVCHTKMKLCTLWAAWLGEPSVKFTANICHNMSLMLLIFSISSPLQFFFFMKII